MVTKLEADYAFLEMKMVDKMKEEMRTKNYDFVRTDLAKEMYLRWIERISNAKP